MHLLILTGCRRHLEKQKEIPNIRQYWDNLHTTPIEDAQPFIKIYLGICLFILSAILLHCYLSSLNWTQFWIEIQNYFL